MAEDDTDTGALRVEQVKRAQEERRTAETTGDEAPARRADKAAYLAAKLAERESSEEG